MAYTINYSGGSVIVADGSLNTDTTLKLPGREYIGYGVHINQDLVDIAGSFATSGPTGPVEAIQGQVWFDRHTPVGSTVANNIIKYNVSLIKGNPDWVTIAASGVNANVSFGNLDIYYEANVYGNVQLYSELDVDGNVDIGQSLVVAANAAVDGGFITTTSNVGSIFAENADTIYFGTEAENIVIASSLVGNTNIRNRLIVDGDILVNGGNIDTDNSTFYLLNQNAANIYFGGDATNVVIGKFNDGETTIMHDLRVKEDVYIEGSDIISTTATFNLLESNVTTLNFAGAATAINMGAAGGGGTVTIRNDNVVMDGDLQIKGGDLTTNQTTFNLLNANATTVNFAGAATTVEIGAATGNTNVNNNLNVDLDAYVGGNLVVAGNLTYFNVETLKVEDPILELGAAPNGAPLPSDDGKDRGLLLHTFNNGVTDYLRYMGWDSSAGEFIFAKTVINNTDVIAVTTHGNIRLDYLFGNYATIAETVAAKNVNVVQAVNAESVNSTYGNITSIVANTVQTTNNGAGTNVLIGNDIWLGDVNVSDTLGLRGVQSSGSNAYINFGSGDTAKLGRAGTGPLTYNGTFLVSALQTQIITTGSSSTTGTVTGDWTLTAGSTFQATYADLAERFEADNAYDAGTVVEFGGEKEITSVKDDLSDNVFGVISEKAAYVMNATAGTNKTHPKVALVGRVPVKVIGQVKKGDRLVSAGNGIARAAKKSEITPYNIIGRSLENKINSDIELILAAVRAKI